MTNRLCYIADDNFIEIDGEAFNGIDTSQIDSNISVIQWYNGKGEIEYKDKSIVNKEITSLDDFPILFSIFDSKKAEVEAEIAAAEAYRNSNEYLSQVIRVTRDKELLLTDFWELPSQQPISLERQQYRQALRDITLQEGFPQNVIWPTKPQ